MYALGFLDFWKKIISERLMNCFVGTSKQLATNLIVKSLNSVKAAFQTESTWLTFTNQHLDGDSELDVLVSTIFSIVKNATLNRPDLAMAFTDLLFTVSRTSLPGEFGQFREVENLLTMATQVLPANLTAGGAVSVFSSSNVSVTISAPVGTTLKDSFGDRVVRWYSFSCECHPATHLFEFRAWKLLFGRTRRSRLCCETKAITTTTQTSLRQM